MPKKRWDFAPEPNEQHRRIAAQHRAKELLDRAREHEALVRVAELLRDACADFVRDAPPEEREPNARRIAAALLQDALDRPKPPPSDNG